MYFRQKPVNSQNSYFHRRVPPSVHLVFHLPLKVSCFTVLFARARRKYLEFPSENQNYAPKNVFFAISLRFCSGFKKHCKTPAKVSGMLPKPSFLHTVSAENRFFKSPFEKTISSRDRVQKLRTLAFLFWFYSLSFFGKKTLSSRKKKYKLRQRAKNATSDPIRSTKTVLFRRTCLITTVFVERIACGRGVWAAPGTFAATFSS